mgnify:CR=1 FL=1
MKNDIIKLLQEFENDLWRQKFSENGSVLTVYEKYADQIIKLFENKSENLKNVDNYYRSDWINPSIQDEIS